MFNSSWGNGADTVTKAINKCLKETGISEVKRDNTTCKEDIQPPKQESVLANLYPPMTMYPMGFHMHLNMEGDTGIGQSDPRVKGGLIGNRIWAGVHAYFVNHQATM